MKCVYLHRRKDNNEIFYVGIGNKTRPYSKNRRGSYWNNIVNKYGYIVEVTHTNLIFEEAASIEKYLIAFYGRKDLNKGTLVNYTDGGEGCTNRTVSLETRKKISKNNAKFHLGKTLSKETIAKIQLKRKNYIVTNESKKKMSNAKIGKKCYLFGKYGKNHSSTKPIICITTGEEFLGGVSEASGKLKLNVAHITSVIKGRLNTVGKRKYPGGLIFKYKDI